MSEQRYPVHVAEDFLRANLPANAKDIKARGYWRANNPAGSWVHTGCIHPYQAAGRWK